MSLLPRLRKFVSWLVGRPPSRVIWRGHRATPPIHMTTEEWDETLGKMRDAYTNEHAAEDDQ